MVCPKDLNIECPYEDMLDEHQLTCEECDFV